MFMFAQPLSYAAHYTFGSSVFPRDSGLDQDLLSKAVKAFIPAFDQLENTTFIIKQKKSQEQPQRASPSAPTTCPPLI